MYACTRFGSTYCQLTGDLLPALWPAPKDITFTRGRGSANGQECVFTGPKKNKEKFRYLQTDFIKNDRPVYRGEDEDGATVKCLWWQGEFWQTNEGDLFATSLLFGRTCAGRWGLPTIRELYKKGDDHQYVERLPKKWLAADWCV